VAGTVGGLAPDLDVLIRSSSDPILYLEFHRQFTHSLIFIPLGAALCALVSYGLVRRWLSVRDIYLASLLGYASHGLLDACTSYGTQLFWPFSDFRVSWNLISVVDPLFTVPLLLLVGVAAWRRRRKLALAAIGWALAYLLLGAVQGERAERAVRVMADARGHVPERFLTKPGFANLLVWKSLYEREGRYYVDAVRLGMTRLSCAGDSGVALDEVRDLVWLQPDSQQAVDLERFAWYADDWLALDAEDVNYVVDVRYSAVPNRISALWGLELNPSAARDEHAEYRVVRSRRTEDSGALLDLLRGVGCEPLP
jgi:inner membrane protein